MPFLMIRKAGKLPSDKISHSYDLEYGSATIEMHRDAVAPGQRVLIHDDLLATGGTMKAAYNLVKKFNPKKIYVNFIMEITDEGLHGRDIFEEGTDIKALMTM